MDDRRDSRPDHVLSFGPFSLFVAARMVKKADEPISLGDRALDILIALAERAGEVVSHKELISTVWPDVRVEEVNLRYQMSTLRKALGDRRDGARYVSNVAGRGYCFVAPIRRSTATRTVPVTAIATTERVKKLPPRLTRMVGRDEIVRSLAEQLPLQRFVSIVGLGGIGKTTVAISVAHTLIDGFHDAIFFIDLAPLTDPQLVPTAIASAVGFTVQTQDPVVSLLAFIGDKKILLVLDNCEHVIDVVAALAERVVSETPQAHILTTSREALRVEGEHVHLLFSLDCPPEDAGLTATEALRYPAAQLFMERAAASGYGAALSDIDARIAAQICRRLDGIALAIELAASRVGCHGIRGTAELLENRFSLLWPGRRTASPRHETLNAMLELQPAFGARERDPEPVISLCRGLHASGRRLGCVGDRHKRGGRYRRSREPDCQILDSHDRHRRIDVLSVAGYHTRLRRHKTRGAWRNGLRCPTPRDFLFRTPRTGRACPIDVRRTGSFGIRFAYRQCAGGARVGAVRPW
jgi:DNA-binding winged helix-turn-helix (wHTH) protein